MRTYSITEDKNTWQPLPIILDTDIGNDPDDLLALAMILHRHDLYDLKAVITTGKSVRLRANFVKHLCALSGEDIPIGVGAELESLKAPTDIHKDFFEKYGADLSADNTCPNAEDVLQEHLSPDVTLITIGPLSTLADFIKAYPDQLANNSLRVLSMGGFVSRKSKKFVKEYNFGSDLEATKLILKSGLEHICVTKNICNGIVVKKEDFENIETESCPVRKFAFSLMKEWFNGRFEKTLYDPFTVAIAINPEIITLNPVSFQFDNNGRCRGKVVENSKCYATIGGVESNQLNWFKSIFWESPISNS